MVLYFVRDHTSIFLEQNTRVVFMFQRLLPALLGYSQERKKAGMAKKHYLPLKLFRSSSPFQGIFAVGITNLSQYFPKTSMRPSYSIS